MTGNHDHESDVSSESTLPTPGQVQKALEAFWSGSPAEFDRLVDPDGSKPGVCTLLAGIIDLCSDGQLALDQTTSPNQCKP